MQLKFSLFSFFIFIAQALSSDIIHLGRDLKLTFPFASDPNLRPTDAPFISGNTYTRSLGAKQAHQLQDHKHTYSDMMWWDTG